MLSWLENTCSRPLFGLGILTRKVGQTDLVLVYEHGSLVGLCTQDYKSLCAAVTICVTLEKLPGTQRGRDRQTGRQYFDQLI